MNHTEQLAKFITHSGSKQSYHTIRLMVDHNLKDDCYKAYGYFRWVDDMVDTHILECDERIRFIKRQEVIANQLYQNKNSQSTLPENLSVEEGMLVALIQNDNRETVLLQSYITNFLQIIKFDACRKGALVSGDELEWYADTLGKAVTDGIQYFVCNDHPYPASESRYLAATAAHITHMLRDTVEDLYEGYINIPKEYLQKHKIDPQGLDISSFSTRNWVRTQVRLARHHFAAGKQYLNKLPALRCKIVGLWYCARFERIIKTIEMDGYILRSKYEKQNGLAAFLRFSWIAVRAIFQHYSCIIKENFIGDERSSWPSPKLPEITIE